MYIYWWSRQPSASCYIHKRLFILLPGISAAGLFMTKTIIEKYWIAPRTITCRRLRRNCICGRLAGAWCRRPTDAKIFLTCGRVHRRTKTIGRPAQLQHNFNTAPSLAVVSAPRETRVIGAGARTPPLNIHGGRNKAASTGRRRSRCGNIEPYLFTRHIDFDADRRMQARQPFWHHVQRG